MSPSTPPLAEHGTLDSVGEESKHVDSSEQSTVDGVEKSGFPEDDATATNEKAVDEPQEPAEHPGGIELAFIMLALVLAIFLFSLDQVSSTAPISSQSRLLPMENTTMS